MNEYQIGDLVRLHGNFLNSSSAAADPSSILFRLVVGSADIQYTWAATTAVTQSGVGSFYVDFSVQSAGEHWYYWRGYGNVQAAEYGAFLVHTPPPPFFGS
jgi:hypothetical protein